MPMNKKTWYNIDKKESHTEVMIYDEIGMWGITAKDFKRDLDEQGEVDSWVFRINSYGGEVFDGFAIYNHIRSLPGNKTVIIDGVAASIASYIAMAGDKIQAASNAFMMIHNPWVMVAGDADALENQASVLRDMKEKIIDAYMQKVSGLTRDEVSQLMDDETYMPANDAKDWGFVDEIIDATENGVENASMLSKPKAYYNNIKSYVKLFQKNKGVTMLKCQHCNKEIAEGSQFCNHCGERAQAGVSPATAAHNREVNEAIEAAKEQERVRIQDIEAVCNKFNLSVEFKNELIASKKPISDSDNNKKILDKIDEKTKPVRQDASVVVDETDKFRTQHQNSLKVALNLEKDSTVIAEARKAPGAKDVHGLMRACLVKEGRLSSSQVVALSPADLVSESFRAVNLGSSDLPAILADTMNKSFSVSPEEAGATFQQFVATDDIPDFRAKTYTKLSSFGDIDLIPEGMDFKKGTFSDKKESMSLDTRGKSINLSRQLLINNDTNAIAEFPRRMVMAVWRNIDMRVYDLLTSNSLAGPVMTEDSLNVFHSTHANISATSGAPSVSTIDTAEQLLMATKLLKPSPDAVQAYANITARYLVTGITNRLAVQQVLNSTGDPSKTAGQVVYNPYSNGGITPVFSAYLQSKLTAGGKANGFYLFADPTLFPTLTVAYLSGYRTPTLRNEPSRVGEALGINYDIFFDAAIGFQEWRGAVFADGD